MASEGRRGPRAPLLGQEPTPHRDSRHPATHCHPLTRQKVPGGRWARGLDADTTVDLIKQGRAQQSKLMRGQRSSGAQAKIDQQLGAVQTLGSLSWGGSYVGASLRTVAQILNVCPSVAGTPGSPRGPLCSPWQVHQGLGMVLYDRCMLIISEYSIHCKYSTQYRLRASKTMPPSPSQGPDDFIEFVMELVGQPEPSTAEP